MTNSRNLIIGAAIVVVVARAYFMLTGGEGTAPQPTPSAKTEPKS